MGSVRLQSTAMLPRAVSVLGELGGWIYEWHADGQPYGKPYRAGRILVSNADGNAMWFLRPIGDGGRVPANAFAIHVKELEQYERFMHRKADKIFNAFIPKFKRPRLVGKLMLVRYLADKGIDPGEVEWEHYFDGPETPAPPRIYALGSDQFFVAPGHWRVGPEGIHYARGGK